MATHVLDWDQRPPAECRGGAVSVGNFDGVHLGHQRLLSVLRERGRQIDGPAVAVTFDPHPMQILRPDHYQPALTTIVDRAELLHRYGADQVLVLKTTRDLLGLSPSAFFELVLLRSLSARALVEGPDFRYGRDRAGDAPMLRGLCDRAGVALEIVPKAESGGAPISSSRVRRALLAGDVVEASRLAQRPYALRGQVARGAGRGRTLGFPTANLEGIQTVIPGDGVYAVETELEGKGWPGAANVGPNPTFGEQARKVEVHLVEFDGDLTGRELVVRFIERIRDTKRFASADELVEQIRADVRRAAERTT